MHVYCSQLGGGEDNARPRALVIAGDARARRYSVTALEMLEGLVSCLVHGLLEVVYSTVTLFSGYLVSNTLTSCGQGELGLRAGFYKCTLLELLEEHWFRDWEHTPASSQDLEGC